MMTELEKIELATIAVGIYAETHLRPPQITQKQAAETLKLSILTIRKLIKKGSLKLNGCGLIPIHQIDLIIKSNRA